MPARIANARRYKHEPLDPVTDGARGPSAEARCSRGWRPSVPRPLSRRCRKTSGACVSCGACTGTAAGRSPTAWGSALPR
jgi:hypothetical protein